MERPSRRDRYRGAGELIQGRAGSRRYRH
jgi:hypothetical protein